MSLISSCDAAKSSLRRQLRLRRKQIAPANRRKAARLVAAQAARLVLLLRRLSGAGQLVAGFYRPLGAELDDTLLMRRMESYGVEPLIPRAQSSVVFSARHYLWQSAVGGTSRPAARLYKPQLVFTPLLGFDRHGFRLGQGGGWYDRLLADGASLAIGLGFGCQEVARLPRNAYDRPLAGILTEQGLRLFPHPLWRQFTA